LLDITGNVLQVIDNDTLTVKAGPGFEGMALSLDGNTEEATLTLSGEGVEGFIRVDSLGVEFTTADPMDLSSAILRLFKSQTDASRTLELWGGGVGTQKAAVVTVNRANDGEAEFRSTGGVNLWNFEGTILQNGTPISVAPEDVPKLNEVNAWGKQQYVEESVLAFGATIDVDFDDNQTCYLELTGDATLNAPTNANDGATYSVAVRQDATGGHTLTLNAAWIVLAGEFVTDANARNIISVRVVDGELWCTIVGQQ
jgi:hypothetical protein